MLRREPDVIGFHTGTAGNIRKQLRYTLPSFTKCLRPMALPVLPFLLVWALAALRVAAYTAPFVDTGEFFLMSTTLPGVANPAKQTMLDRHAAGCGAETLPISTVCRESGASRMLNTKRRCSYV